MSIHTQIKSKPRCRTMITIEFYTKLAEMANEKKVLWHVISQLVEHETKAIREKV